MTAIVAGSTGLGFTRPRRAAHLVENTEKGAPRPHGLRVLAGEHVDDLAEMIQVVDRPRAEELPQGHRSEVRMPAPAREVPRREPELVEDVEGSGPAPR